VLCQSGFGLSGALAETNFTGNILPKDAAVSGAEAIPQIFIDGWKVIPLRNVWCEFVSAAP
jgi:hypothetical protein